MQRPYDDIADADTGRVTVPHLWLRETLEHLDVTQAELAARLATTTKAVGNWCTGTTRVTWIQWQAILSVLELGDLYRPGGE